MLPDYGVRVLTSGPALVGRSEELTALAQLFDRVGSGERIAPVLILGPAGTGKTALIGRLSETIAGMRRARGVPWERDVAGGVLAQLAGVPAMAASDASSAADALAKELSADGRATLVVVDDADQSDGPSLEALSTLLRRHPELPVLVLLAARCRTRLLEALDAREVELSGVSADAVAEIASGRGHTIHPATVQLLWRHTGGNPRDVLALLAEVPADRWSHPDPELPAPRHVQERVAAALAATVPAAQALIEAVAILDGEVALSQALELADLEEDGPTLAEDARATGLITVDRQWRLRMTDPMVRLATLAVIGPGRSAALHRRAAAMLHDLPVRRWQHLVQASPGPDAELADNLEAEARRQGARGAWAEAARLWQQAARLTPDTLSREHRIVRAVDALVAAGEIHAAAGQLPVVESLRETPLRDGVLGYLAILRGRHDEAAARLRRADDIVNGERDPETSAMIAQRHVLHALSCCQGSELVAWADRAVALAGGDSPAGLEACAIRPLGLATAGSLAEARAAYDELSIRVDGAQAQRVAMGGGWLDLVRGDLDAARARLESALATDYSGGSVRIALWAHAWLARVHVHAGDWDDALATAARGLALAEASGITLVTPLLHWSVCQVDAERGRFDEAEAHLRAAESVTRGYAIMQVPCLIARAQLAEARADAAGVIRALDALVHEYAGTSVDVPGFWAWQELYADALLAEGRADEAEQFLQGQVAAARPPSAAHARLAIARGRLAAARGDIGAAAQIFDQALGFLESSPLRFDTARVAFAYGLTLRRAGRRREADRLLEQARHLWLGMAATIYVERCERELNAGGRSGVSTPGGAGQLTPQEQAVSSLVAQGMSNREVAAQLFLSPKTVQYHLTRVYGKLGVRTRAELAAAYAPTERRRP